MSAILLNLQCKCCPVGQKQGKHVQPIYISWHWQCWCWQDLLKESELNPVSEGRWPLHTYEHSSQDELRNGEHHKQIGTSGDSGMQEYEANFVQTSMCTWHLKRFAAFSNMWEPRMVGGLSYHLDTRLTGCQQTMHLRRPWTSDWCNQVGEVVAFQWLNSWHLGDLQRTHWPLLQG